jgi:hypothetical protein
MLASGFRTMIGTSLHDATGQMQNQRKAAKMTNRPDHRQPSWLSGAIPDLRCVDFIVDWDQGRVTFPVWPESAGPFLALLSGRNIKPAWANARNWR